MKNTLRHAILLFFTFLVSFFLVSPSQAFAAGFNVTAAHKGRIVTKMTDNVQTAYYFIRSQLNTLIPTKMVISACLAAYDIDEIIEMSSVIATGHFTGQSDAFRVQTADGGIWINTDYYFAIDNVLKGEPYADTVNVRSEGGTVGTFTQVWDCSPEFDQENTYLLFLFRPGPGGGYYTEGDYYYVRGALQGAYIQRPDGSFYNAASMEELPLEALISPQMDEALTEEDQRNELIETYRNNYETGFDTWEEYQKNLAELDLYATILD